MELLETIDRLYVIHDGIAELERSENSSLRGKNGVF